jgi:hypothetical protein
MYTHKLNSIFKIIILNGILIFNLTAARGQTEVNQPMIDQVKMGKLTTARAEWWGFDKNNSTDILQKAINSGAKKLIVSNMGSPWIVAPIKLQGNQEIIFENGVVVKALSGVFRGLNDCLFSAVRQKNIILRGNNATLMMNIKDYQNPKLYKHSEWRMGISLRSCENVKIIGLTIKDTGGDAIYLGASGKMNYCKDILIDQVICEGNHRQGISVISAENLVIRNSQFNNTRGTAPMAGIDFEPNHINERLVNCVVENCIINGNNGYGILVCSKLSDKSKPISITARNCKIEDNAIGICLLKSPAGEPANGKVSFMNCQISNSKNKDIDLRNFSSKGWKAEFKNCQIKNSTGSSKYSPIMISLISNSYNAGNITFDNFAIADSKTRKLLQFDNFGGNKLEKMNGKIVYNGKKIDIAEYIRKNKLDIAIPSAVAPLDISKMYPVNGYELKPRVNKEVVIFYRDEVRFLIAAEKGKNVKFNLNFKRISPRRRIRNMKVSLVAPSGEKIEIKDAQIDQANNYSFIAPKKGIYELTCNARGDLLFLENCNSPFSVAAPKNGTLKIHRPKGKVYFAIPAGVKEFSIVIAGEGSESISADIFVEGKRVAGAKRFVTAQNFSVKCFPSKKIHTGCIVFSQAVEDAKIKLPMPLSPVFAYEKSDLILQNRRIMP